MQQHIDEPKACAAWPARTQSPRTWRLSRPVRSQSQAEQGLAAQLPGEWGVELRGKESQGMLYPV